MCTPERVSRTRPAHHAQERRRGYQVKEERRGRLLLGVRRDELHRLAGERLGRVPRLQIMRKRAYHVVPLDKRVWLRMHVCVCRACMCAIMHELT